MSSNDVAVRGPSSALAIADGQTGFSPAQVAALRHLGAEEAGEGDLAVFFHQATRTGLDPFAKQIYLIGRRENRRERGPDGNWRDNWGTKYTIQTGIDGFRLIADRAARRHQETLGYEDTLWRAKGGQWTDSWDEDHPPAAAKVVVLRNGNRFPAVAHFREYAQEKSGGGLTSMWARMPAGQLGKCAEALALRKAFPQDLSGIYTDEEMGQADARAEQDAAGVSSQRVTPPRAGQRVIDGETAPAAPSIPVDQPDSTGRDCAAWQAEIAALPTLDAARKLWVDSGKEVLARDCDGIPLYRRLEARMTELRDAEAAAAAQAAAAADGDDDGPVDVPEGVGEPMEPADGDGTMAAPLEGEVLDAPADAPAAAAEADPEDLRRNTPQRRATLQELTRLFRGGEAMAAACEQHFGLVPDDVATNRLRRWMSDLQREGS